VWFEPEALTRMTTYTGIGPSAERLSGRKGFAVGGLMGEAFNRKAAASGAEGTAGSAGPA